MPDMHDTRRREGGGPDPKPVPVAQSSADADWRDQHRASVPAVVQSAAAKWDEEDRRKLWRQVTNLGEAVKRGNVTLAAVIGISILLVVFSWCRISALEEGMDDTKNGLRAQQEAIENTAYYVNENRAVTAAALKAPMSCNDLAGWEVVKTFNDLRVLRLRPGTGCTVELSEYEHPNVLTIETDGKKEYFYLGPPVESGALDKFVHLDDATYALAKDMKTLDVAKLKAASGK